MAKIVQLVRHSDKAQVYPRLSTDQVAVVIDINKENNNKKDN